MTNTRLLFSSTAMLCLMLSCEVGPQGTTGPPGPAGSSPGSSPDCPDSYIRDSTQMNIVLCRQGMDEVVKVGTKGSAFWIDRYEASIWDNEDGSGKQYGAGVSDYPATFPGNGQASKPLYALSRSGVTPSTTLTWFQANEACRSSGKRLPSSDEWFAAVRGTIDPGDSSGAGGTCVTNGPIRTTGSGSKCVSDWGVQDMVGNIMEMTAEWQAAPGSGTDNGQPWPAGFGGDESFNIVSSAFVPGMAGAVKSMPSVISRGGDNFRGVLSGIFTIDLSASPVSVDSIHGFRCIIPR